MPYLPNITIRYAYLNDLLFILPFSFFLSSLPFFLCRLSPYLSLYLSSLLCFLVSNYPPFLLPTYKFLLFLTSIPVIFRLFPSFLFSVLPHSQSVPIFHTFLLTSYFLSFYKPLVYASIHRLSFLFLSPNF